MPQLSQLVATLALVSSGLAQLAVPTDLVGTWSTKSNATLTGPGFYDPVNEKLIEPKLTGISYSFTADGHYEEAYYRAISNPQNPSCPSAIMQWQHGSFVYNAGGSLTLTPIAVDGRQLLSSPCDGKNAIYTRYNQSEQFQGYRVYLDDYHKVLRLDISKFDGSPMQPMYIRFKPAMMLPTTTLNPLKSTASATAKAQKRSIEEAWMAPLKEPNTIDIVQRIDTERLWWIGVGMTGIGGLLYLGPRRLGVRT